MQDSILETVPYVRIREDVFRVRVEDDPLYDTVTDEWRHAWVEQKYDPTTGTYSDAEPAREGSTTINYLVELRGARLIPGLYWCKLKGDINHEDVYEVVADSVGGGSVIVIFNNDSNLTYKDSTVNYRDVWMTFDEFDEGGGGGSVINFYGGQTYYSTLDYYVWVEEDVTIFYTGAGTYNFYGTYVLFSNVELSYDSFTTIYYDNTNVYYTSDTWITVEGDVTLYFTGGDYNYYDTTITYETTVILVFAGPTINFTINTTITISPGVTVIWTGGTWQFTNITVNFASTVVIVWAGPTINVTANTIINVAATFNFTFEGDGFVIFGINLEICWGWWWCYVVVPLVGTNLPLTGNDKPVIRIPMATGTDLETIDTPTPSTKSRHLTLINTGTPANIQPGTIKTPGDRVLFWEQGRKVDFLWEPDNSRWRALEDPGSKSFTVQDTTTVDLTLTGTVLSADVIKQMSITSDASGLKLVGDATTPGNSKYYGTDSGGTKGFHDLVEAAQDAVGGILTDTDTIDFTYTDGGPTITADVKKQMSITSDSSGIKLVSDATSPGNSKYYGTDSGGTKGFHDLPSGGGVTEENGTDGIVSYSTTSSFADAGGLVTLPDPGVYLLIASVQGTIQDSMMTGASVECRFRDVTNGVDLETRVIIKTVVANVTHTATACLVHLLSTEESDVEVKIYARHAGGMSPTGSIDLATFCYVRVA